MSRTQAARLNGLILFSAGLCRRIRELNPQALPIDDEIAMAYELVTAYERCRMAGAMRALYIKRFREEWWADARRTAQQAQEAGATQFLAICPDGGIRDLLDGDKEWTE